MGWNNNYYIPQQQWNLHHLIFQAGKDEILKIYVDWYPYNIQRNHYGWPPPPPQHTHTHTHTHTHAIRTISVGPKYYTVV